MTTALASTKGQLAPLKDIDPKVVLERYLAGETSPRIAESLGVTKQALSFWLISKGEEDWRAAQLVKAIDRKERADEMLEKADNALDLTRAREMLRSAQWDLERVCRRIYGQEAPGVTSAVQINIGIRRDDATTQRTIDVNGENESR